ncbi:10504_t:CDS:2 [Gigaspora margarita]|uniref:10504_t:CDS:1 n=1 Tax=Gigaspora margarita TaxID=4874 RepID=A0ABN7UFQ5_GIGMA|nr:10504_t:CDS:2 [Gigaspora margarita]
MSKSNKFNIEQYSSTNVPVLTLNSQELLGLLLKERLFNLQSNLCDGVEYCERVNLDLGK